MTLRPPLSPLPGPSGPSSTRSTAPRVAAVLGLAALALAALVPGTAAPVPGAEALVVLEEDEPQTTYPFAAWTMSEQRLAELLFDRFFVQSLSGATDSRVFQPPWSLHGQSLDVSLRPSLRFSNGKDVTLDDLGFTLGEVYRRRDLGHRAGDWYAGTFGNFQPITPRDGSIPFLVPVPETGAEQYLSTTVLLSRKGLPVGQDGRPDLDGTRRRPVGTGPFAAVAPIDNFKSIHLVRNAHRLAPEGSAPTDQRVQALDLLYAQDAAFQKELMVGGRADLWVSPPPAAVPELRAAADRFAVRSYDLKQWWYIALDLQHAALRSPQVREALDLVVPRADLRARFGGDSATLTSGPFPAGSAFAPDDVAPTALDPKRAASLLRGAGWRLEGGAWTGPSGRLALTLGVEEDIYNDYADVLFALIDAWTRFGVQVQVRPVRASDWRTLVETGRAGSVYNLILGRWNVDREASVLELFGGARSAAQKVNLFQYRRAEVDTTIEAFHKERRGPEREALMKGLHRLLHDDRPYLFLWSLQVQSVVRRDRWTGLRPAPFYFFTDIEQVARRTEGR